MIGLRPSSFDGYLASDLSEKTRVTQTKNKEYIYRGQRERCFTPLCRDRKQHAAQSPRGCFLLTQVVRAEG